MINSPSTDFLIRIKNGYRAGRKTIKAPFSRYCESIAGLLQKHNLIENYNITDNEGKKEISLKLKYNNRQPVVYDVKLFSKPGRRLYEKASSLPWGVTPNSLIIISTSQGLMSQKEATAKRLGGEVVAELYLYV